MSILSELNEKGFDIEKSDRFYRGIYNTEKGTVVTKDPSKCDAGIYFLKNSKGALLPCNDQVIFIMSSTKYEGKALSAEEATKLAKAGEIISFKSSDVYAEYYDFASNEDLECCFRYGYSARSRRYVESVMKNIGLLKYTDTVNSAGDEDGVPSNFDKSFKYDIHANAKTEVGKIDDDLWIAQTLHPLSDDFVLIKMYFNHEPSKYEVETAFDIRSFESNPTEVFKCWECGKLTHWLDIEGNMNKKLEMAREKCCGC